MWSCASVKEAPAVSQLALQGLAEVMSQNDVVKHHASRRECWTMLDLAFNI